MIKRVDIYLADMETGECFAKLSRELPLDKNTLKDSPMRKFLIDWVDCLIRGIEKEKAKKICLNMEMSEPQYNYVVGKLPF